MKFLRRSRGNATLISLIIMASALTISLGMAAVVAGEIKSSGLVPPAEKAYYKAESYVEQALFEKKLNPNYSVTSRASLAPTFLCDRLPCFGTGTETNNDSLVSFQASTSPVSDTIEVYQDQTRQLDLDTTGATARGIVRLSAVTYENNTSQNAIELTIVAYPKSGAANTFTNPGTIQSTPVFIDKKVYRGTTAPPNCTLQAGVLQCPIGASGQPATPTGDLYPSLITHNYRIRLKALGSNAFVTTQAFTGNTLTQRMTLRSPDFFVQSVAQDQESRRGVRVSVPATEQPLNIFDYVIFSQQNLTKLDALVPAGARNITVTAHQRSRSGDCTSSRNGVLADVILRMDNVYSGRTNTSGQSVFQAQVNTSHTINVESVPTGFRLCPSAAPTSRSVGPVADTGSQLDLDFVRP